MGAVPEVRLEIRDRVGSPRGQLVVSLLPRTNPLSRPAPLLDLREDADRDHSVEPVQLLEGIEYRYSVVVDGMPEPKIVVDPTDLFEPDTDLGQVGRLRPGLHTGVIPVVVRLAGQELGRTRLEVRSRKLEYLTDYRWMLRDIAEGFAEIVMERFAPTEQSFEAEPERDAATLYQRFAFLKALVSGEAFDAAMHQIISRPYRAWVEEIEFRSPVRGASGSSRVEREVARLGPRLPWPGGPVSSLPRHLPVVQADETLDTPENRFVKYALTRWREVVAELGEQLSTEKETATVQRGKGEVAELLAYLDSLLSADLFREVGPLGRFPSESQVLQKRAGYRDIYRAYVQSEVAASLTWDGGEDVYGAGQRNVATLYEYWVFLKLADAISHLCHEPLDRADLLNLGKSAIGLKRGQRKVLSGTVSRLGRRLRVEVSYNRSFPVGEGVDTAWTRPMQPDCSVLIKPEGFPGSFEPVWLHFDAKYRVDSLASLFGKSPVNDEEVSSLLAEDRLAEDRGAPKRADLLKMHAYRDAIRRSAGAYVIYPGTEKENAQRYHEILPGLGAFALRPSESGDAEGIASLQQFIDAVMTHVASQVTQHERSRYWEHQVFGQTPHLSVNTPGLPFLRRPPADSIVLLGYVKSAEHLAWVRDRKLYNLRADGRTGSVGVGARALSAEWLLLYGPDLDTVEIWSVVGEPALLTRSALLDLQYPSPRGEVYFCLTLGDTVSAPWTPSATASTVEIVRQSHQPGVVRGAPVAVTWLEVLIQAL